MAHQFHSDPRDVPFTDNSEERIIPGIRTPETEVCPVVENAVTEDRVPQFRRSRRVTAKSYREQAKEAPMNKPNFWKAVFFLCFFCAGTAIILPAQTSDFWSGTYFVSTCNTPGYIGSGDPCSYIVWSLYPGDGGFGTNTAGLYVGPNQANTIRYEQEFDSEFCSAGSGVDLSSAGSWTDTEDLSNV